MNWAMRLFCVDAVGGIARDGRRGESYRGQFATDHDVAEREPIRGRQRGGRGSKQQLQRAEGEWDRM